MVPRHVEMVCAGVDGITVRDPIDNIPWSIGSQALRGNGWIEPATPGGKQSLLILHIDGEMLNGLKLVDPIEKQEYWVSSTALISAGCTRKPEDSGK